MTTVYIVDDDAGIRDAFSLLLSLKGYSTKVFASADDFLQSNQVLQRGCLLLDLKMADRDGMSVLVYLQQQRSPLKAIMITAHGDANTARLALKNGAFDFLEKPVSNDILLDVVQSAMAAAESGSEHADDVAVKARALSQLTSREAQVMELLAEGKQLKVIGAVLGISPRTVEVYKARLFEKLQISNLAELVRFHLVKK